MEIAVDSVSLQGDLTVPDSALGVVLFAHGSGSSRLSPRNRAVAAALNRDGLATLLFDLLTATEADDRQLVFDISLLAARLESAVEWMRRQAAAARLPVGLFGASTGAAAALVAAADLGDKVRAVVSRGGRPDLAGPRLGDVRAPTLLIVGGNDRAVLSLNLEAQRQLQCATSLEVVPGATHLFEEPGALESVAQLASRWFVASFARPDAAVGNSRRDLREPEANDPLARRRLRRRGRPSR
jgi:putative phosphoribosyl transferase